MAGQWQPGESVPDRWLVALVAGTATLDETCDALAEYEWPDSTPATGDVSNRDPYPEGGWIKTMDAAFADGQITPEQYDAIWTACR